MRPSWQVSPSEAIAIQKRLKNRVHLEPLKKAPRLVAGADVSFNKYSPRMYAGFVILETGSLRVIERAGTVMDVAFPYIPGLLSFREIPPFLEAWKKLKEKPEVLICDGQGIAHPRGLGIASHLGLILDLPAVGCAKSILVGKFAEPQAHAGSRTPIIYKGNEIGAALRTKNKVKPVFVSPGHRCDTDSAVDIILSLTRGYRLPEPTRLAHLFVNELRRADLKQPFKDSA